MSHDASDVSVVMAVRNGERYIHDAIMSLLDQDPPPGEVVVVDDGSTDRTVDVLRGFGPPVRVIQQGAQSQAVATNRALAAATGSLFAFLDSDDLYETGSLACRLERLNRDDRLDGAFGRLVQFVSPEIVEEGRRQFRFDPNPPAALMLQTLLVRRGSFDRVGPLDERLRTGANIDWASRARAEGLQLVEIPDVVARRRLHANNLGVTMDQQKRKDLLTIVRAHRARGGTSPGDTPTARP